MSESTGLPLAPNGPVPVQKRDLAKEAEVKQQIMRWLTFAATGVALTSKDPGVQAVGFHIPYMIQKNWEECAAIYWAAKGQPSALNASDPEMLNTLAALLKAEFA